MVSFVVEHARSDLVIVWFPKNVFELGEIRCGSSEQVCENVGSSNFT